MILRLSALLLFTFHLHSMQHLLDQCRDPKSYENPLILKAKINLWAQKIVFGDDNPLIKDMRKMYRDHEGPAIQDALNKMHCYCDYSSEDKQDVFNLYIHSELWYAGNVDDNRFYGSPQELSVTLLAYALLEKKYSKQTVNFVRTLLLWGADANIRTSHSRRTPLDIAIDDLSELSSKPCNPLSKDPFKAQNMSTIITMLLPKTDLTVEHVSSLFSSHEVQLPLERALGYIDLPFDIKLLLIENTPETTLKKLFKDNYSKAFRIIQNTSCQADGLVHKTQQALLARKKLIEQENN